MAALTIPSDLHTAAYLLLVEKVNSHLGSQNRDGCLLWPLSCDQKGYGQIRIGKTMHRVHRVAFATFRSSIPDGVEIIHSCDTPACFNPLHISPATHAENIADRERKGRNKLDGLVLGRLIKGEDHGSAKLTDAQVAEIRARYAGGETQADLAASFSVCQTAISLIVRNKRRTY